MYEDYIERGPGEFMGNFTGMPLTDEGRAKALLYTSNLPSTYERQCLPQSAGIFQYRPVGLPHLERARADDGSVVAWVIGGDNLRNDIRIWMDGRPHPSPNALHLAGGFATGKWEGDTLTARLTHLKTAWIRRGVGIPASDQTTITMHITRRDDLLTITTIQEDPYYLTEPHVVSRVWQWNPRGTDVDRPICNTANEIPSTRGHRHRAALPAGPEPGRGLHGPDVQPAEGSGDGVRGDALSRVPQEDQGHLQAAGRLRQRARPGTAAAGSRRRDGRAARPT